MKQFLTILLISVASVSCSEKKSNNALEIYKYWVGAKPPKDMELLEGQYWESAHWTKEYILFLKFKPSKIWWDEFLKQNHLSEDSNDWTIRGDAPIWFKPSVNSKRYRGDGFNQSRYFCDNQTGICYIYEILL